MNERIDAERRVAVVTGASGGIGQASARALREAGFIVVGTSRNSDSDTAADGGGLARLDVADDRSVETLVADVIAQHGRIDVLVNNAGAGLAGAAEEASIAQVQQTIDINLTGVIRMTNAVLPHMRDAGRGRIVNVSSVLGVIPAPFMALYAATKFAVEGYSESLDHEVRTHGIRVSLVEPGYTKTGFEANTRWGDSPLPAYEQQRASVRKVLAEAMRTADAPEIVAEVVLTAATVLHPKVRYTAGRTAKAASLLRRVAPASFFDAQIRKLNGLTA
ncbi:NAD(P)-dependent dehydrogenase (short-subunit alcohol dehydrogenase family) [Microbacterium sp. SORGH_AS428]|uniref:oxidoreductase n=1 Tax=Microbacterium sp. SORGH_AS_0428 TaxID=3041788 RepID=UPI002861CF59|nr:oxidoreductase [Microbacterium sp. SORGH_AS_0428]MDR6200474.1 NAD(P)-dependent dehydrogenase (short-subunit alcohol dehydrogenase family) [Microbacterium sp. SORGH_AS_0428]